MSTKLLRAPAVCEMASISERTLYRWIQLGLFPKGRLIGRRVRVWDEKEIEIALMGDLKETN